jgi:hypothetical protein
MTCKPKPDRARLAAQNAANNPTQRAHGDAPTNSVRGAKRQRSLTRNGREYHLVATASDGRVLYESRRFVSSDFWLQRVEKGRAALEVPDPVRAATAPSATHPEAATGDGSVSQQPSESRLRVFGRTGVSARRSPAVGALAVSRRAGRPLQGELGSCWPHEDHHDGQARTSSMVDVRRAQNRKPATYRCPLCGYQLHAMSEHMLIAPEGDTERRRRAHSDCVLAAARSSGSSARHG